jgi:hypothetical protein
VSPLVEIVKGRQVQVGFTIGLFARLPLEKRPGPGREAEAAEIRAGLREIVQLLAPPQGGRARLEIDGSRPGVSFAPEGQMQPEIGLDARVFQDDYFAEATAAEEDRLRAAIRRLTEMGLKERRRRTP